jgi:hypothetical protein
MKWTDTQKILPKMSSICYALRFVYHFSTTDTLKIIYFAYFNSITKYGATPHTGRVFQLHKKTVGIMTGTKSRISCKPLFKALEILTLPSQYILSLITFVAHNLEYFTFNFELL